jgi:hypothetical protein
MDIIGGDFSGLTKGFGTFRDKPVKEYKRRSYMDTVMMERELQRRRTYISSTSLNPPPPPPPRGFRVIAARTVHLPAATVY